MKIIDILNAKANGTLEDGFKFAYEDYAYTYTKETDRIISKCNNDFGDNYKIERCLNDEVEVISDEIDIDSIKEYKTEYTERCIDKEVRNKINELVQAVKQLNKKVDETNE